MVINVRRDPFSLPSLIFALLHEYGHAVVSFRDRFQYLAIFGLRRCQKCKVYTKDGVDNVILTNLKCKKVVLSSSVALYAVEGDTTSGGARSLKGFCDLN